MWMSHGVVRCCGRFRFGNCINFKYESGTVVCEGERVWIGGENLRGGKISFVLGRCR